MDSFKNGNMTNDDNLITEMENYICLDITVELAERL